MKAAIFSNHSPRVGFGVDRKMAVSRSQVMVVAASRNQIPSRYHTLMRRPPGRRLCFQPPVEALRKQEGPKSFMLLRKKIGLLP